METLIEASAEALSKWISEEGISYISSIGVAPNEQKIFIYLEKRTSDHQRIPKQWDGFDVVLSVTSGIQPL